jgi:sec-independent protein translocase protein TatA
MPSLPSVGPWEVLLVLIVALLVFGPRRLPQLGRGLGTGLRELRSGLRIGDGTSGEADA